MTLPRWLVCTIDSEVEARVAAPNKNANDDAILRWLAGGWQVEAAERGDPEPLRLLYPDLAGFLHSPKRRRGERGKPPLPPVQVQAAADLVPFIKKAWRRHHGRRNRRRGEGSAEESAAEYCDINTDAVLREIARRAKAQNRGRR